MPLMGQQLGDIEADTARADHRNGRADTLGLLDGLGVAQHAWVIGAG